MFEYQPMTNKHIKQAIRKLNPFKALGANSVPNVVIKQCANTLIPFIGPIFQTTFTLEVYLDTWKDSVMRVGGYMDGTWLQSMCCTYSDILSLYF